MSTVKPTISGSRAIDFVLVGAEKAASTWIWHCLDDHPDCSVSHPKELNYFNFQYSRGEQWYLRHYDFTKSIVGDVSPLYMYDSVCAKRIYEHNKDMKILICLRNPYKRSMSHLYHEAVNEYGNVSQVTREQLVKLAEKDRRYIERSLYSEAIENYLEYFSRDNIEIVFYESLVQNNKKFISELYGALSLGRDHIPASFVDKKKNNTVDYRSRKVFLMLRSISSFFKNSKFLSPVLESIHRRTNLRGLILGVLQVDRGREEFVFDEIFSNEDAMLIEKDVAAVRLLGYEVIWG